MPTYTQQQYDWVKKQKAFAWAKYYESMGNRANNARVVIEMTGATRVSGNLVKPTNMPKHITDEYWEMANALNKEFTCNICFNLTTKETLAITYCGHMFCKTCLDKVKEDENAKCPICRKAL